LQATTEADVRNLMGEHPLTVVLSGQVGLADIAPFYAGIPEEIKDKQVAVNTSFTFTDEKIVVGQLILDMPEHFKLTGSGSVASYKDVRQMKGNFVLRGELPDVGFFLFERGRGRDSPGHEFVGAVEHGGGRLPCQCAFVLWRGTSFL
jgi:hypothetical protein